MNLCLTAFGNVSRFQKQGLKFIALSEFARYRCEEQQINCEWYLDYFPVDDFRALHEQVLAHYSGLPGDFMKYFSHFLIHETQFDFLLLSSTKALVEKEKPSAVFLDIQDPSFENRDRWRVIKETLENLEVPIYE